MTYKEPRSRHAEGYLLWQGGRIVCRDDNSITIVLWIKDQRDYLFEVQKKIRREELK